LNESEAKTLRRFEAGESIDQNRAGARVGPEDDRDLSRARD